MILGILQARMSSSRLPGKVMKTILGVPMLLMQIKRINRCSMIDKLIVATSLDPSDDPIESLCIENNISIYRGSLNDVLDRFYRATLIYKPDHIVRLTGDCPLSDPQLIDNIISHHIRGNYDYTSNSIEPTYPDGLDTEVFRFSCLVKTWEEAKLPSQREHVTPYIYQNPDIFKIEKYGNDENLSSLRWTVDEQLDYELITIIYQHLFPTNPNFNFRDVLLLLELHPELKNYNTKHQRNEGYTKSLSIDKEYLKGKMV